jgi:hypothetical protein
MSQRHPDTEHLMRTLEPNPNLPGPALNISHACNRLAQEMCGLLGDGPELRAGLRKLREAKDCFVLESVMEMREALRTIR